MTGMTVADIARMAGGTFAGNGHAKLEGFGPIDSAGPGALTFLANPKYNNYLYTTHASAVLVERDFQPQADVKAALIFVDNVYQTLSALLGQLSQSGRRPASIEQPSWIAEDAVIGIGVYIGAFAYIGPGARIADNVQVYPHAYVGASVEVGEDTTLYSGVKIYDGCVVGNRCIIHSGAVIGSDGFGFARGEDGSYAKVPQVGRVILHDDVEIGANTTIDRATLNATIIGKGAKLDNLIQIAHNVEIGENTVIAAQAGISGSTKVGARSSIGGQVGIIGHIKIAEGSQIAAQSGVANSLEEPNGKWFGSPAIDYRTATRAQVIIKKLPELYRQIQTLDAELKKLQMKSQSSG